MMSDSKARYRNGYRGGMNKYDFSLLSIGRAFLLLLIPIMAWSIAAFPVVYSIIFLTRFLNLSNIFHALLFTFLLTLELFLFIILETFIPALFIKGMNLKVEEGVHDISIKDKNFFRYILFFILYRTSLKIVGFLPLLPLRIRFLKLVGLKMGKSSVLAGSEIIHDPYAVEIGEQTLIGGYSWILGHITEEKLMVKKVKIGNNCIIGGGAVIMPGVIIEDNVVVGINTVVPKNRVLKAGGVYVGNPAREVKRREES